MEKVDRFLANEAKGQLLFICCITYGIRHTILKYFIHTIIKKFACSLETKIIGAHSMKEMVSKLKKPRRVMMLVKAGSAVDSFIDQLVSHLTPAIFLFILMP